MLEGSTSGGGFCHLPDASCGQWFVLHTKSRQERALAQDLISRRIACYLPLVRRVRVQGLRRAVVDVPLFPRYVFLRGTADDAYLADRTRRLAAIIRVAKQERLD